MRKVLSIVLAGLLIMIPVDQVLAQAVQTEAVSLQKTASSDGAAQLFRVPPLTENSARLLITSYDPGLLDGEPKDAVLVQDAPGWWSDASRVKKVGIVLGAVVVVGAIAGGINAAGENDDPDSFKSKYSVAEGAGRYALWAIPATALGALLVFGGKYLGSSQ